MQKPNNYDNTQIGGDYVPVELGGHHAIIKEVKEQKSKNGKNMVVVAIDFAPNDKQAGYFMEQFKNDTRTDKKYPYQAIQYILTEDNEGQCSRNFKSFITAFEDSNSCDTIWGDKFPAQFKNKKIGVVYGEVEEEYDGEVKTRRRIRWFCDDKKAEEQKTPARKELPASNATSYKPSNDFVSVPEGVDEEIPF